jgi:hypothetical protein
MATAIAASPHRFGDRRGDASARNKHRRLRDPRVAEIGGDLRVVDRAVRRSREALIRRVL